MRLFNSKTQRIAPFLPSEDETTLYLCGPGFAESKQLAQAFLYCATDVLVRYLAMKGWAVKYAQLVVPGHDDTPPGSFDGAEMERPRNKRVERFVELMRSLNVRPPDYFAEATADGSTMLVRHFGPRIDIRVIGPDARLAPAGGGPAQIEAATGWAPAARFRLDVVTVKNAESEDNPPGRPPATVDDMLGRYSSDAIRLYLARHHYRTPWTHDEVTLEKAAQHAERLGAAMQAISTGDRRLNTAPAQNRFEVAMDDDLESGKGIATLLNLADEILFRAPNGYYIDDAQAALGQMASVFGLRLNGKLPEEAMLRGWNECRQHFEARQ